MKKNNSKKIEAKYEELEQYDSCWNDDVMTKKEEKYAYYIGTFLIRFSSLEHSLDIEVANLINANFHDLGYILTKDVSMFGKIELFYNLAFQQVNLTEKRKNQKIKQLTAIRKILENLATLRNKIAHAKWNTLDKDGYVRIDTKISKENGFIKFKKTKINLTIMGRGMKEIEILKEKLPTFVENVWQ